MSSKLDEKIKAQEERLKQLKAQKQAAEARTRAAIKKRERQNDTRRKILAGAWLLSQPGEEARMLAGLDVYLTANRDRALFGLPLREE